MADSPTECFDDEGRFVIQSKLGEGGMGVVYQVLDRRRGAIVALKTMGEADPRGIYQLKKEFRALAGISHPHLVQLHELGCSGDRWFFTMDLVRGRDFVAHVRCVEGTQALATISGELAFDWYLDGGAPPPSSSRVTGAGFDEQELRLSLWQLAGALSTLHRSGRVHRDLKPSNVLIDAEAGVRVLDFGLTRAAGGDSGDASLESLVAGTPAYMAPEQATGDPVSTAADWYAVGVMLYQALTGVLPFGGSMVQLLTSKQLGDARPPGELVPGLPDDLAKLCVDLLARDPADRPTGEQVVQRLSGSVSHGAHRAGGDRDADHFVGRAAESAAIQGALDQSRQGAVVVHLVGEPGTGKTAFARHVLKALRLGALVLAGRCHPHESVPYKAVDAVVDALARYLHAEPEQRARSWAKVAGLGALLRLFPVLRRVRWLANAPDESAANVHAFRRRAFGALRDLLAAVALEQPTVVWIDDAHWGDADSAELLAELLRPPSAPRVLAVLGYRPADAASSPFLTRVLAARWRQDVDEQRVVVTLGPLADDEAKALVEAHLGDALGSGEAARLAAEAGGNPQLVVELARHARSYGAADRARIEDALARRLAERTDTELAFLEVLAVGYGPLPVQLAAAVSVSPEQGPTVLAALAGASLVRISYAPGPHGSGPIALRELVDVYHERVRHVVLSSMQPARRRQWHARLSEAFEASGADLELAAWHAERAGEDRRAAQLLIDAALVAKSAFAFDRTAELLVRALQLDDVGESRGWLLEQLGDALSASGRSAEAAAAYQEASEAPISEGARRKQRDNLDLTRLAAEHLLKSGRIDEGLASMAHVLEELDIGLPRSPRRALISLNVARARLAVRGLEPSRPREPLPRERQRLDTYWSLAVGLSMADTVVGADFHARHLLAALDVGAGPRLARALAMEAAHVASTGSERHARALELLEKSEQMASALGDLHGLALAKVMWGGNALFGARWREALGHCDSAVELLTQCATNVAWETASAWRFSFSALFFLGELAELARRVPRARAEAKSRGDHFGESCARSGSSVVVWLLDGDVTAARRQLDEEAERWHGQRFALQHFLLLHAQGYVDLYERKGPAAWAKIREAWPRMDRSLLLRVELLRTLMLDARGRIALAAGEWREAERAAGQLEREGLLVARPQALALYAGATAGRSQGRGAGALYREAALMFDALEMSWMAAAMRVRRAEVDPSEQTRAERDRSLAVLVAQGTADPHAMVAMLAPL